MVAGGRQHARLHRHLGRRSRPLLGLVIALTLNAHMPGRGLLRAAVLIPWAIPTVVSAKMWGWMLHDLYGVVNAHAAERSA